jgi:CRP/FNR family transcriptional regulator, cyclic AMP receptor protein
VSILHRNAKIDLIRRAPLFSHCSRKELEAIASIADEIDLPKNKTLIREGERGREFFIILEGQADVKKGRRSIRTMGPGDFFGEIALIANTPRTATVVAKTPLRTLVITDRAFRALMDKMPELQGKVMQVLAERLNSTVL